MRKLFYVGLIALAGIIIGLAWAEQITLTTYYPAPYGVYREFTTTGNTYLATQEGDVGIGTTNPTSKLDVAGTAQLRGAAEGTGLYVDSSGNVGIGTTVPGANLEINNTLRLTPVDSSNYDIEGGIYYDDDEDIVKYHDGSDWKPMGGGLVFGEWQTTDIGQVGGTGSLLAHDTNYQAVTDGLVVANIIGGHCGQGLEGYTDNNNPASTLRIRNGSGYIDCGGAGFSMPVKRNDWWRVKRQRTDGYCWGTLTIYWIPLGQ